MTLVSKPSGRLHLICDGPRAETRLRLSPKRTSPFKSAGGISSVDYWQPSCPHQRSGSNAGYTMFRGSVNSTGYPLHSPVSPSLPPPSVHHREQSHFNWTLHSVPDYCAPPCSDHQFCCIRATDTP